MCEGKVGPSIVKTASFSWSILKIIEKAGCAGKSLGTWEISVPYSEIFSESKPALKIKLPKKN